MTRRSTPPASTPAGSAGRDGVCNPNFEELSLLLRLSERLVSELDVGSVLPLVADTACELVQAETLAVPMIDFDRQTYTYVAASGKHAALLLGETFPIDQGACGWVIEHGRPLLIGESPTGDPNGGVRWEPGMASSLLVPLICRGHIIGGLSAMAKRGGGAFSERDLAVLGLFANQASIAIDNARLFRKLAEEESRLRLVLDSAGEGIYGVDTAGLCTFANAACVRMLGYAGEADLIGKPMHATIHHTYPDGRPYPAHDCCVALATREGRAAHADDECHWRADGSSFPIEFWSHPLYRDGRLEGAVVTFIDITERKKAEEQIRSLAYFDVLTNLPNRRLLLDRLGQALAASERSREFGALMILDLDNFKSLNDTQGHDVGDRLLIEVAQRIAGAIRAVDTVSRLGGDEYVVLVEGLGPDEAWAAQQADAIAEKVRIVLNEPFAVCPSGQTHTSTPSIGVTLFRGKEQSVDVIFKQADVALYQAKNSGRNAIRFFNPAMQAAIDARMQLENALRRSLQHSHFVLHYQPLVDATGRVVGAEALLRWQHPERATVAPADFIPLAEDTGLILPLGHWVLETACAQLAVWAQQPATAHLTMAVNVSARQFHMSDFADQVLAALDRSDADPARLNLEITESLLLDNLEDTVVKMTRLKDRGVSFSLDDFGTGYSSLSYLKRLPLDVLKIDKSFVLELEFDESAAAICAAAIGLANSLNHRVVAEGVETEAQRDFLTRVHRCDFMQGFLFEKPLPLAEFDALLRAGATLPAGQDGM